MRAPLTHALLCCALLVSATFCRAHFGVLLPQTYALHDPAQPTVSLTVAFAHPMQAAGLAMQKPRALYAFANGKKTDLLTSLQPTRVFGQSAFHAQFRAQRPQLTQLVLEPSPYWEAAEERFIVHLTKTYLPVFGEETGWETPVGLPVEIVPLTRPFGNWARTVFQGRVLKDGKALAHCPVEIEYFNHGGKRKVPDAMYLTQQVVTDANGVFTASVPWGGWWGFAALTESEKKIQREGKACDVELGAVLWSYFEEPQ